VGRPERAHLFAGVVLVTALLLSCGLLPEARAVYPPVPLVDDGRFLTNLSAPVLAPGSSGIVSFSLTDPLSMDMVGTTVSIEVYAFNAYPGNATQSVPANAVTLAASDSCCNVLNSNLTSIPETLVPGAPLPVQLSVVTASSAPSGTYALRFQIDFTGNGTDYRLASRGEFSDAQWAAATTGPGGTSTLNLTQLGVSGIIPETAVLVRANPFPTALAVILAASLILAAAGGYYAFRRPPKSRSGAATPDDPSHAPTAFGKRRSSDGD
jgi:hypothetical protein